MKYSTSNLDGLSLGGELSFPIKIVVEYRPNGELADYASVFVTTNPELATDEVVRNRGWNTRPGFTPKDVWVDGAI